MKVETPTIAVFATTGSAAPRGLDLANADGLTILHFELMIPMQSTLTNGAVTLDLTSPSSAELVLSALWRDVVSALQVDPAPWSQLWRAFIMKVPSMTFESTSWETQSGGRIAGRTVDMKCEVLSEPISGIAASGSWADLLQALQAAGDDESVALATYLQAKIENNVAGTWQVASAGTGVGVERLYEMGTGPLEGILKGS